MAKKLALIFIALFTVIIRAAPSCTHSDTTFRCVKVIRVYDGDTFTVAVPSVHPLLGHKVGVRINGVDTPERRTKDVCEKRLAMVARDYVAKRLFAAKSIELRNVTRGKYFRIVADVFVDGKNLGEGLIKDKLAYAYHGQTKQRIDWCNFQKK